MAYILTVCLWVLFWISGRFEEVDQKKYGVVAAFLSLVLGFTLHPFILISFHPASTFYLELAIFHLAEFLLAAFFHSAELNYENFLLNNGLPYTVAILLACGENSILWGVGVRQWVESSTSGLPAFLRVVSSVGALVSVCGLFFRLLAVWQGGKSFTHKIKGAGEKRSPRLVTQGLYSLCRHPGYLGWTLWVIATQLMLLNLISLCLFTFVTLKFFKQRIEYEEYTLVETFGKDYVEYHRRVPAGLPFIETAPLMDEWLEDHDARHRPVPSLQEWLDAAREEETARESSEAPSCPAETGRGGESGSSAPVLGEQLHSTGLARDGSVGLSDQTIVKTGSAQQASTLSNRVSNRNGETKD
uniref:Protein-S-isoprenylcysteine O-methyltransferase n=1 Tax=Chromera velia CCMP2878 TaxID=1169474 RepID=A0A0G4GJG8_9ALVE|eukprot:Cvel_22168.t1-p1 / transcript=Cvel_22168.t1 / gene=Cvel_22168 / organism=Chromera_velia_CCMP2878 / gene_product=Protein-S-isoprenylcysteine O-methyltransferase, putative / transcript_product=Protein-S-isoprenylcysteine O-methyltransferase, putative / location=Cvel_scaffold2152:835-2701(+) / protein_length=357 / sequence_SO=supercontig / SO=protein_coding / is_pseudo=false